jgi:hypothetical protein
MTEGGRDVANVPGSTSADSFEFSLKYHLKQFQASLAVL